MAPPITYVASFPGCSHLHILDHLQYASMEGEGLGDLVTCGYLRWTDSGQHRQPFLAVFV